MTHDEYVTALQRHDWHYDYSDDHNVWRKGREERLRLEDARRQHDRSGALWNQYAPEQYRVPRI